jgi:SAM-dependent methyltransferase
MPWQIGACLSGEEWMTSQSLKILKGEEHNELIVRYLEANKGDGNALSILEAGCGRRWPFKLNGVAYRLVGIDMDREAIAIRQATVNDLDEVIVGDLRQVQLTSTSFDAIYNSFVLEHVAGAEKVLKNFIEWLKPGGMMIITIPDPESAYGFVARHTPHWFHVWFYRYIGGNRNAGKPGYPPYPTFYDEVVSRRGMRRFAQSNELEIVEECGFYRPPGLIGVLSRLAAWTALGKLAHDHTNLLFVIRKLPQGSGGTNKTIRGNDPTAPDRSPTP